MPEIGDFLVWFWLALAAILVVAEMFTTTFVLFWFGLAAAVAGVLALLGMEAVYQVASFVVVAAVLVPFSRRFAERVTGAQPPGIGADRLIGKIGVVIEEVDNLKPRGRVRVNREEWRADSAAGESIPEGTKVRVARVEGTRLIVNIVKGD